MRGRIFEYLLFFVRAILFPQGFERFSMQRGTGGQDDFFHRRDLLGNFWGFGSRQRMMPSLFGDRDVFDDPFFTHPFGSLFDSGMFGSSASAVGKDQTNRAAGIVIEELNSDDEGKLEEDEDGPGAGKDIRQKHSSSSKEPFVEHPDDDPDGTKSNILIHSNDRNKVEGAQSQSRVSVQTSRVTYGGVDGAYYTSTRTTKRGTDGVVLEETQEADRITGQAKHRISRGIQDKGHSVTRKLNSDGKVDTLQTLHNLDEDELADFEENWKGKGNLSGWEDRLHMNGNRGSSSSEQSEKAIWGGWPLPSVEQPWRAGRTGPDNGPRNNNPSAGRTKKVVRINIE